MRTLLIRLLPVVVISLSACGGGGESAASIDLVLRHGTIYTADDSRPSAEAVAVKDGKIVYVGDDAGVEAFIGTDTRVIDLEGGFVYPGFVDAHAHFTGIGEREQTLSLQGINSKNEFLDKVAEAARNAKPGEWITGRGWIETFWDPPVFPTRFDLDRVAPNNPVILTRADGHASIANSAALALAGVSGSSTPPPGGAINLDVDGQPTGMLIDRAQGMVGRLVPPPDEASLERALELASERSARLGWTQIQDAHGSWGEVARMRKLFGEGRIKVRIYKAISGPGEAAESLLALGPQAPEFDDHLTIRTVKVVVDGALGSRGAALLEPYSDDPHTRGLITTDTVVLKGMLERALRAGIQVEAHAIGDRANRVLLDMFEVALNNVPVSERAVAEPRWRNEHSQIVNPDDLARFKTLGIIASMQPSHAIGDLFFVPARIGLERTKGAYAWKSFLDMGVVVAGGSDAPVELGEPMIEFYAAVARKSLDGKDGPGWHPEEKVSREEALKMFTLYPAIAAFEESRAGTITVNKRADFTILDRDIMTVPEPEILKARNMMTIVGGKVVYQAQ
ncbi:MAG: amidohydrolase [Gemmatimonadales bacterium]|nr:amidohydrolase [Gemmatimonadales bacterium]MDZ4390801.1 amidohydrolase [Gemmatimonadales bacterium]